MASRFACVALLLTLCACATGGSSEARAGRQSRDMTVLTRDELMQEPGGTLYDQIRRTRPNWLRTRGASSLTLPDVGVVVYQENVRLGGVSSLRDFTVETVERVEFLSGPEATSRFGLDHPPGAIVMTLRRV